MAVGQEPRTYRELVEVSFLGRRFHVLDLSREIAPGIPVYPGHMKVAMWDHLTHAESRMRLGDTPFRGYAVKGIAFCDHDSTHMDAVYHYNPDRPDLTIEKFPIEHCFTEGAWIDVSDVPPRTHITLARVRRAMAEAGIERLPRGGTLLYYTGAARLWDDPLAYVSQYPGLDEEASRWILDQGVVNVLTDAVSTDNPADLTYPNHRTHAEYLVNHTEVVNNIEKIPMHQGFGVMVVPLRFVGGTASPVRIFALWEA
ncbi:MAG TPA: cyclase family protein [Candidatus Dormibacteraeota bacterium]|nr:cyclase family protein [Candidatus Dormibacteraeota bacterium]